VALWGLIYGKHSRKSSEAKRDAARLEKSKIEERSENYPLTAKEKKSV
jgi:hypothetical protein